MSLLTHNISTREKGEYNMIKISTSSINMSTDFLLIATDEEVAEIRRICAHVFERMHNKEVSKNNLHIPQRTL